MFLSKKDDSAETYDDSATVKSMDISEYGCEKQLPVELDAAALATAQFLNGNIKKIGFCLFKSFRRKRVYLIAWARRFAFYLDVGAPPRFLSKPTRFER